MQGLKFLFRKEKSGKEPENGSRPSPAKESHEPDCVCDRCGTQRKQREVRGILREFAGTGRRRPAFPAAGFSRKQELLNWGILLAALILIGAAVYFVR